MTFRAVGYSVKVVEVDSCGQVNSFRDGRPVQFRSGLSDASIARWITRWKGLFRGLLHFLLR